MGWSDYCEPLRSTLVTAKATGPTMPTNIAISGPPTTTCIPLRSAQQGAAAAEAETSKAVRL